MRAASLALCALCAVAAPAAGQSLAASPPIAGPSLQSQMDLQARLAMLRAQQDLADRRLVIEHTALETLETQLRAEQGLAEIRAESRAPQTPAPLVSSATGAPAVDVPFVSIPDAALAASEARVRAVSQGRR